MLPSPNTQVFPVTYQVLPDGAASLAGLSVTKLIQTFGSPLYVLDEATLRQTMRAYTQALRSYAGGGTILYAAKANLSLGLCAMIQQEGLGLDVVSGGEYYTALKAGFPTDKILFNGNNKGRDELSLAIYHGISRISVDNPYELELIHHIAMEQGKRVPVVLRVTPGIECHTHDYIKTGRIDSKFGFTLESLPETLNRLTTTFAQTIELTGLHAHIGSQIFETQPYSDLVDVMMQQYQWIRAQYGLTLTHLNLGGGLGIQYQSSDDPPDVSHYASVLLGRLTQVVQQMDYPLPHVFLEPGRSLVATAGVTLYTIGSLKPIPQIPKTYVAVDGGMGDNIRPALYGAQYTALVANKVNEAHDTPYTVVGKYCESGDIILPQFLGPASLAVGDYLMVFGTGAYNYSMSSNYNRVPRPATLLVNEGQAEVLIQRETWDDLIRFDQIPNHLQSSLV